MNITFLLACFTVPTEELFQNEFQAFLSQYLEVLIDQIIQICIFYVFSPESAHSRYL